VVDDSDDTRELMASVLRAEGLEVVEAHNGVEGLGFLGVQDFDLILSDLNMPLMGGFDLFERSNVGDAPAKAILYSASDTDADEIRALRMGAIDYFRLPINPEILRLRVRRALG
jgi:DNA-binding response OmpR family regulator